MGRYNSISLGREKKKWIPPSSGENYFQRLPLLDPFGFTAWPGAVRAAQPRSPCYNCRTRSSCGDFRSRCCWRIPSCRPIGGKASNIDGGRIAPGIVQTKFLDLFASSQDQPLPPPCDLWVVADVLYNEHLAKQVYRRCVEVYQTNFVL